MRDLALLAQQHGAAGDVVLRRITKRAKALTAVDPKDWSRMVWLDRIEAYIWYIRSA